MYSWLQPVVSVLALMLTLFFQIVQDWGVAIVLFTIFVRLILFPLNLRVIRQQILQVKIQPELKAIRERYENDQNLMLREMIKLNKKYEIKPFAMFGTAILQMPIFMGMYTLFLTYGTTMSSFLIPWVVTFAQADNFHIIPFFSAVLTFISSLIPLTNDLVSNSSIGSRVGISLLAMAISLMFLWRAPVALGLYWTTGSLFSLLEREFYRTRFGKAVLLRGTVVSNDM